MARKFFIRRSGKVTGPVSPDDVTKGIDTGKIRSTDDISNAATGPWKLIGDVPTLAKLIESSYEVYDDDYDPLPASTSRRAQTKQSRGEASRTLTSSQNRTGVISRLWYSILDSFSLKR